MRVHMSALTQSHRGSEGDAQSEHSENELGSGPENFELDEEMSQ